MDLLEAHAHMQALAGPELVGVLHAGGVLQDALLPNQTAAGVRAVFAPKASGSANLARLTRCAPLGALKLFSSVAAAMGSGGQANYAAANAVLDNLAQSQQSQACLNDATLQALHKPKIKLLLSCLP